MEAIACELGASTHNPATVAQITARVQRRFRVSAIGAAPPRPGFHRKLWSPAA
jgi:hypothetical protein